MSKPTTTDELRAAVEDLLRQATEEHSHYYTAEVLRAVLGFIIHAEQLEAENNRLREAIQTADSYVFGAPAESKAQLAHRILIAAIEGGTNGTE